MKFISTIALSLALICGSTYAQGIEEICHAYAKSDVELKEFFSNNPKTFPHYLKLIEERKDSSRMKAMLRERAYWTYNRRTMSNEYIQRLSFIRCLTQSE